MRECEVHLVVPSLVDSSDMFWGFFDERDEDEAEEAGRCKKDSIMNIGLGLTHRVYGGFRR